MISTAKLAKARRELIAPQGGGGGGAGVGFDVARTGIASVGFVGFPSVGKVCVVRILISESTIQRGVRCILEYFDEQIDWNAFRSGCLRVHDADDSTRYFDCTRGAK